MTEEVIKIDKESLKVLSGSFLLYSYCYGYYIGCYDYSELGIEDIWYSFGSDEDAIWYGNINQCIDKIKEIKEKDSYYKDKDLYVYAVNTNTFYRYEVDKLVKTDVKFIAKQREEWLKSINSKRK